MSQVLNKQADASAVQHSRLALEGAQHAEQQVLRSPRGNYQPSWRRRLTVDIRIDAAAADDSPLSGLVVNALREYIDSPAEQGDGNSAMVGKFESKDGLDVSWRAINRFYEDEKLVGEVGVNDRGERVDSMLSGLVSPDPIRHPVPMALAQMEGEDTIVIRGVRYSLCVFETLANPDPDKRYSFTRQRETVAVVERP